VPHFRFAEASFEQTLAHLGKAPIASARVLSERVGSSLNFLDLVRVPVGADIGTHQHRASDEELYIIIKGQGVMLIDGERRDVGLGDVLLNPPGGTHGLINSGTTDMWLVVVDISTDGRAYEEPLSIVE
jgi:mannose-6-phosphate isomerase-like protein (cupin superfamily)